MGGRDPGEWPEEPDGEWGPEEEGGGPWEDVPEQERKTDRKDRDHKRDKEPGKGKDRKERRSRSREGGRSRRSGAERRRRSRSRDRRRRSRDRSRERPRRHHRRSRSHSRSRSRSRHRKRSKKEAAAESAPESLAAASTSAALLAAQQVQRSRVWVGNIPYEIGEEHVRPAFEAMCGPVKKVDMSNDPATGRHRGYCFLEFFTPEAAQTALTTMTGHVLGGRGIKVGMPNGGPVPSPAAFANPTVAALVAQQQAGELAKSLGISKPGGIPPTIVQLPTRRSGEKQAPIPPVPPLDPLSAQVAAAAQMLSVYARLPGP